MHTFLDVLVSNIKQSRQQHSSGLPKRDNGMSDSLFAAPHVVLLAVQILAPTAKTEGLASDLTLLLHQPGASVSAILRRVSQQRVKRARRQPPSLAHSTLILPLPKAGNQLCSEVRSRRLRFIRQYSFCFPLEVLLVQSNKWSHRMPIFTSQ